MPVLALVTFPAAPLAPDAMRALLDATAPRYLAVPGLRRKYFLHADGIGGGAYEWDSRESAERFYDDAWRARMIGQLGTEPRIQYFAIAALADAERGQIERHA